VYFHELDAQSKLVQSKRFMLERISGRDKKRTLSRPQSAETWRRHHFNKGNKENKLSNLLTVKGMDLKRQTSYERFLSPNTSRYTSSPRKC